MRDLAGRGAEARPPLDQLRLRRPPRASPTARTTCPHPRSIYALTKLAGEYAALAYGDGALVVRTAGLYGVHGSASKGGNFVQRMLGRAREQGALKMVADQRLQPTFTADLAAALVEAVEAGADGVLHLTAAGACSWFEFTEAIMRAGRDRGPDRGGRDDDPAGRRRPAAERGAGPPAGRRARPDAAAPLGRGARRLHDAGRAGRRPQTTEKGRDQVRKLETKLDGPVFVELTEHGDERGFFAETYRDGQVRRDGDPDGDGSRTTTRARQARIVRGMHFQLGDGVAKLVRCGRGAIYDVVVDLRRGSPTYGQWEGFELTEDNMRVVYCPVGFGHGFCALSDVVNDDLQAERLLRDRDRDASSATRTRRSASSGRCRPRSCRPPRRTRRRRRWPSSSRGSRARSSNTPARAAAQKSALGFVGDHPGDRQRGGGARRGRVAHVQRALGPREDEVVDRPPSRATAWARTPAKAGLDVGGPQLRHVAGGGGDQRAAQAACCDLGQAGPPPAPEHPPGAGPGERAAEARRRRAARSGRSAPRRRSAGSGGRRGTAARGSGTG